MKESRPLIIFALFFFTILAVIAFYYLSASVEPTASDEVAPYKIKTIF